MDEEASPNNLLLLPHTGCCTCGGGRWSAASLHNVVTIYCCCCCCCPTQVEAEASIETKPLPNFTPRYVSMFCQSVTCMHVLLAYVADLKHFKCLKVLTHMYVCPFPPAVKVPASPSWVRAPTTPLPAPTAGLTLRLTGQPSTSASCHSAYLTPCRSGCWGMNARWVGGVYLCVWALF